MTSYKLDDIKKDVRIALDENSSGEQLEQISDVSTLQLDDIIESSILDAMRIVALSAPLYMLEPKSANAEISWRSVAGTGIVALPSDFLRIVSFKMSDWLMPVVSSVALNTPEYKMQFSKFEGLRGSYDNPKIIIEGNKIYFFSSKSNSSTLDELSYISMPCISSKRIEYPYKAYRAAILKCASMIASTLAETQLSQSLNEMSNALYAK